jgi:hypothetical protein
LLCGDLVQRALLVCLVLCLQCVAVCILQNHILGFKCVVLSSVCVLFVGFQTNASVLVLNDCVMNSLVLFKERLHLFAVCDRCICSTNGCVCSTNGCLFWMNG